MRKLVVLWKWACEKVFLIEGTKNIMQGLAELRLLGLYLEKSWLLLDLGSDKTHWADYGCSPTFLPMLLHATNKCRNSWSATTAGYKVIVVEVPGTFGLQPLWTIEAHRGAWLGGEDWGKMYTQSELLETSHPEGSWSRLGVSSSRDGCGSAPTHVPSDVILGAALVSVCLAVMHNWNTDIEAGVCQVSVIGVLVEMQWQSAFSFETVGWGCLPPPSHTKLGETVGCSRVGATSITYQQDLALTR